MIDMTVCQAIAPALLASLVARGGQGNGPAFVPVGAPTAAALWQRAWAQMSSTTAAPAPPATFTPASACGARRRGPDNNANIDACVNTLQVNDSQRKALMQKAAALQATLIVDIKDDAALDCNGDQLMASSNCGIRHFSPYEVFSKLAGKIEA